MISVRQVLTALAVAFTAYMALRGMWWWSAPMGDPVREPWIFIGALVLYLVTTWITIFWRPRTAKVRSGAPSPETSAAREDDATPVARVLDVRDAVRLPAWAAALALACSLLVPASIALAVAPNALTAPFATWYLGGIGFLMTIVVVRRRPWVALAGIVSLAVTSSLIMGPLDALLLGLVGSMLWVAGAQGFLVLLDRAARDTQDLTRLQRSASVWQASQSGRQRERRVQVQRALAVAGPVLSRVVASAGRLDADERLQARLAEGHLRDEMRGRRLLDDDVRAELERVRRRGSTVTVLDEGGLDAVDPDSLAAIRAELAETLRNASSDRVYIRTSPHERVAVTVVGRSGSAQGLSDEDSVDLWREIDHPGAH